MMTSIDAHGVVTSQSAYIESQSNRLILVASDKVFRRWMVDENHSRGIPFVKSLR